MTEPTYIPVPILTLLARDGDEPGSEPRVVLCQSRKGESKRKWRHNTVTLSVEEARRAIEFLREFVSEQETGLVAFGLGVREAIAAAEETGKELDELSSKRAPR